MDPNNPVVRLCAEGMAAEAQSRMEDASALFLQAWELAKDDYEACVAAHYVARHQDSPQETLRWNQVALQRAEAAGSEQVQEFFPSLYLNLGWSYESLGDREEAHRFYDLAQAHVEELPAGPYRDMVQEGITNGLQRVRLP